MEILVFAIGVLFGAFCHFLHTRNTKTETNTDVDEISKLQIENEELQKQIKEVRYELDTMVSSQAPEPVLQPVQTLNIAYPGTKRKFDFTVIPGYKYAFLPREIQEASKRYRNLSL